jgi:ActR/RegA family two-component response regulator
MPARFVVVHDDAEFTHTLVTRLGPETARYTDPVKALKALETAKTVAFLVTRLQFGDRQPLGLSLARLARAARPDVRVIFTGAPEHRNYARGLGEFVPEPVNATHVGMVIEWLSEVGDPPD